MVLPAAGSSGGDTCGNWHPPRLVERPVRYRRAAVSAAALVLALAGQ